MMTMRRPLATLSPGERSRLGVAIMVSSGAIAEGMKRLGWSARPHQIHELQAAAAVGSHQLLDAAVSFVTARVVEVNRLTPTIVEVVASSGYR